MSTIPSGHEGAAAAGLLHGILAGWRKNANPGALDDMGEDEWTYTPELARVVLTLGDGHRFSLLCVALDDEGGEQ